MTSLRSSGKKNAAPDAYGFVKYVTNGDLKTYIGGLKPKATKKKPLSFDRLNIIMMSVFKFLEEKIKKEPKQVLESLDAWLQFVKSQKEQNLNTIFESQLNLYLVLSEDSVMKAKVFVFMTKFLQENGQLESVMIAQVRDVINLSANWNLTNDERMNLYTECAKSLDLDGDSQGAFAIYFESL